MREKIGQKPADNGAPPNVMSTPIVDTFEAARLAKLCHKLKCKTVFIAYPQDAEHPNGSYEPNREALDILREYGMITLDLRHTSEISTKHYKREPFHDWTHMNDAGRKVYTDLLATKLEPLLAELKQENASKTP